MIGQALILVIMYVETDTTDLNVFINNDIMFDVTLTDNLQYHHQTFILKICFGDIKGKI
jgi:hypothetical protein